MRVRVSRSEIRGATDVPPSKSLTHRAIIIASIVPETSTIHNPLVSEDTKATIAACRKIGAEIGIGTEIGAGAELGVGEKITIHGIAQPKPAGIINANNSGTTLRLMAGVCSLAHGKTTLTGDSSLLRRPMLPILNSLKQLGAKTRSWGGLPPVSVSGPLKGGKTTISGAISQFVSSLLITGLRAESGIEIELTTALKSRPYVDLTEAVIRQAGGSVERAGNILTVPQGQSLRPLNISIEPDFSSASFLLAAGAMAGEVTASLNIDSLQGDRKILQILGEMGAEVERGRGRVIVRKAGLTGITADLSDTPDLLPIVSVLMSLAKGKSTIVNTEHAREKESDRIHVMARELNRLGGKVRERPDGLEIIGVTELRGVANSHADHRVAMALMVAGLGGSVEVAGTECTDVSFPGFAGRLRALGANLEAKK